MPKKSFARLQLSAKLPTSQSLFTEHLLDAYGQIREAAGGRIKDTGRVLVLVPRLKAGG